MKNVERVFLLENKNLEGDFVRVEGITALKRNFGTMVVEDTLNHREKLIETEDWKIIDIIYNPKFHLFPSRVHSDLISS